MYIGQKHTNKLWICPKYIYNIQSYFLNVSGFFCGFIMFRSYGGVHSNNALFSAQFGNSAVMHPSHQASDISVHYVPFKTSYFSPSIINLSEGRFGSRMAFAVSEKAILTFAIYEKGDFDWLKSPRKRCFNTPKWRVFGEHVSMFLKHASYLVNSVCFCFKPVSRDLVNTKQTVLKRL